MPPSADRLSGELLAEGVGQLRRPVQAIVRRAASPANRCLGVHTSTVVRGRSTSQPDNSTVCRGACCVTPSSSHRRTLDAARLRLGPPAADGPLGVPFPSVRFIARHPHSNLCCAEATVIAQLDGSRADGRPYPVRTTALGRLRQLGRPSAWISLFQLGALLLQVISLALRLRGTPSPSRTQGLVDDVDPRSVRFAFARHSARRFALASISAGVRDLLEELLLCDVRHESNSRRYASASCLTHGAPPKRGPWRRRRRSSARGRRRRSAARGDRDPRVAEPLADDGQRHALGQQGRRRRVAEVMEPHRRDARAVARLAEHPRHS